MIYERPTKEDTEGISTLFLESFNRPFLSKKFCKHMIDIYLKYPQYALVAKDDDKIVGFVYAIDNLSKLSKHTKLFDKMLPWRIGYFLPAKTKHFDQPFALVYCVDKDYRNLGIASKLFDKILQKMKQNHKIVYFQIHLNNKPSLTVADKFGSKLIETRGLIKKYGIFELILSSEKDKKL